MLSLSACVVLGALACFPELGEYRSISAVGGGGAGGDGGEGVGGAVSGGGGAGPVCFVDPENETCADCVHNGLETDVDCGGDACPPCELGQLCSNGADCTTGTCEAGLCAPQVLACSEPDPENPSCGDCERNGLETGIDCGGDACPPCELGAACATGADCVTGTCDAGQCAPQVLACSRLDPDNPSCGDCVENGAETDVDCGGDACPPCQLGADCSVGADCASGACGAGQCVRFERRCPPSADPDNPTCADCVTNGAETDEDCGGDACAPCDSGQACLAAADCSSGTCDEQVCL